MWEEQSRNLNTAESKINMSKIAKQMKKGRREVVEISSTSEISSREIMADGDKVCGRWREHISTLKCFIMRKMIGSMKWKMLLRVRYIKLVSRRWKEH